MFDKKILGYGSSSSCIGNGFQISNNVSIYTLCLEEILAVYIFALDVSKGHSFGVLYQRNTCQLEFEITHNKPGFEKLPLIVNPTDEPTVYFETTGVNLRRT